MSSVVTGRERQGKGGKERSPRDFSAEEPNSFEIETEELDPRVQEELEKLNNCTDEINRLEIQLDDANTVFRSLLSDSTHHLKSLSKKLGSCIEKARPYYEAVDQMTRAQAECQKAAVQFQRAAGIHAAAKETISLAEERFLDNSGEWQFDNAWQEMLNHATIKVMDAEKQRTASEKEHLAKSAAFTDIESKVKGLEKKLNRHIEKSKPYFEQKDIFNKALNSEKTRVGSLQVKISHTKAQYAKSLRNLEDISESIHARRKLTQSRLENPEFDSLTYDLSNIHLRDPDSASVAASDLTCSDMEGRDSALGSTSLAGESVSDVFGGLEQEQGMDVPKMSVERSTSLPEFSHETRVKSGGHGVDPILESLDLETTRCELIHARPPALAGDVVPSTVSSLSGLDEDQDVFLNSESDLVQTSENPECVEATPQPEPFVSKLATENKPANVEKIKATGAAKVIKVKPIVTTRVTASKSVKTTSSKVAAPSTSKVHLAKAAETNKRSRVGASKTELGKSVASGSSRVGCAKKEFSKTRDRPITGKTLVMTSTLSNKSLKSRAPISAVGGEPSSKSVAVKPAFQISKTKKRKSLGRKVQVETKVTRPTSRAVAPKVKPSKSQVLASKLVVKPPASLPGVASSRPPKPKDLAGVARPISATVPKSRPTQSRVVSGASKTPGTGAGVSRLCCTSGSSRTNTLAANNHRSRAEACPSPATTATASRVRSALTKSRDSASKRQRGVTKACSAGMGRSRTNSGLAGASSGAGSAAKRSLQFSVTSDTGNTHKQKPPGRTESGLRRGPGSKM